MTKYVIEGCRPLSGTVTPAGNKNEVLPAIMACLLTDETVTLKRVPKIRDVVAACEILEELGVEVGWEGDDTLILCAAKAARFDPSAAHCAAIRASILLLGPLLSRFGKVILPPPGGDIIGARRMDPHFEGIEALGGILNYGPPITGKINKIIGCDLYLDEPSVTATENLIMLAVRCEGITRLYNAACEPHVVGLCKMLQAMGAKITGVGSNHLEITGVQHLRGCTHTIGPDFMEVGSFLCLGAIAQGQITIENVQVEDLRFVLKTLNRIGVRPELSPGKLMIDGQMPLEMQTDLSGRIGTVYSGPWPAFPTDLMSVALVAATQAKGTMIFHEKMYEGRMFFTDKLISMGANLVLCDPHRVVVTGPSPFSASNVSSPDVRAGMAVLMAAAVAKGTSEIHNIQQIERGYFQIEKKLEALGAAIKRVN